MDKIKSRKVHIVVVTVAMLVNRNNRNHLHKSRVLFPKDGNFIIFSDQHGHSENHL